MKENEFVWKDEVISDLCRQMAMLLGAGISIYQSIEILKEDPENGDLESALYSLSADYLERGSLAAALGEVAIYPKYMVQMVRLGEETGRLDDVMFALADHYAREASLKRSIREAIVYPGLMLTMLIIIMTVLLTQVMPVFDKVFAQLGTRLTGLSLLLLELGEGIQKYALVLIAAAVLLVAGGIYLYKKPKLLRKLLRFIPFFKNLWHYTALTRFVGSLSMGLASGLSTDYALELSQHQIEDPVFLEKTKLLPDAIHEGQDLAQAMVKAGLLSGSAGRLAMIGQRTGTLAVAFSQVAEDCREKTERMVSNAVGLMEPVLVAVLSVLVGVMLLSVLMPMLGILAAL